MPLAAPALAGPTEDFEALTDDYWAFVMRENPTFASQLGMHDYDDRLGDISLAAEDRRAAQPRRPISSGSTPFPMPACRPPTASTRRSSSARLRESIEANRFGQRVMLFSNRSGWHQNFAGLADGLTFRTRADYDNYLKRLGQYPALNDEALKISTQAIAEGYTLPCASLDGFEGTISGVIPADATKSRLYAPFAAARPAAIAAGRLERAAGPRAHADRRRSARGLCQAPRLVPPSYKPKCATAVGTVGDARRQGDITTSASASSPRPTAPPTTSTRSA